MSTPDRQTAPAAANSSLSLGSVAFLSVLVTVVLVALAFWPRATWSPPRRPPLSAPIVFDELVSPPPAPPSASNEPAPR